MQNVMTGDPGRPAPAPGPRPRPPAPGPELERWRAITTRFGRLAGALTLQIRLEPSDTL
ncbi:hypothetical protein AB0F88_01875 [Streptosporangium sp. NPDC023963]|uniref:hypothetical protein n=1 Tax=Streptosporangium sp. NPDC023963 TaxID=3155608 RepID=UPI00343F3BDF